MSVDPQQTFNGDTVLENVYIYGNLYYDFSEGGTGKLVANDLDVKGNLDVTGISTFRGPVFFDSDVNFDYLQVGIITVTDRIDVGVGGTGVVGVATNGRVGIGSTLPKQRLDIAGSVHVLENIFDSANSPGINGYYLQRDAGGIRWAAAVPDFSEGIYVQDQGINIPKTGVAQSFTTLNFSQVNSLGIGTTSIIPIVETANQVASIQSKDLWGYTGSPSGDQSSIYRMTKVGIQNNNPSTTLDITGSIHATAAASFDNNLTVGGATQLDGTLNVDGSTIIDDTLRVTGNVDFDQNLNVDGTTQIDQTLTVDGASVLKSTLNVQNATDLDNTLNVDGDTTLGEDLAVSGNSTFTGTALFEDIVELDSSLRDVNNDTGAGAAKTDYRLASVGTGVSWRPAGVQTKNTIWVTLDGRDTNSGMLEGDAKRTIAAAAAVAEEGDTILVRAGVYEENNPIGLRTDVSISGEDLRLVTVVPNNTNKDVFHVRRGCLIQNLNFAGSTPTQNHVGCGAVAFPPISPSDFAATGYIAAGPANEGASGIYKSPYVRNCTNFMTGSIGMKINGDHVNAAFSGINSRGQDIKSMVCDSFTQYNQNGVGVSIINNAYAQLVSIFTIGCDTAIYCDTGGQCDLTNSNSSFGNFGLVADGVGDIEFTATVNDAAVAGLDVFTLNNIKDSVNDVRKPFDGQAFFFKLNLDDYDDVNKTGITTAPLQFVREIKITNTGSGYNQSAPPNVIISTPQGPESILAELEANVSAAGSITSVDVIASGRNFLPTGTGANQQPITVTIAGSGGATAEALMDPIYYTVSESTEPVLSTGIGTVTFNEFIPYKVSAGSTCEFKRISRIITSSHSFEYVGAGTDLNKANPFQGGVPLPANEIVAINGGQVPFTSTDQKGNFRIGEGLTIDQTTSTISGRDFNRAIQAQLTPLILALR